MRIIDLTDKNKLNEFIIRAGGSFLESYEWGEFQQRVGNKIWRLVVLNDEKKFISATTLIKKKLIFNKNYFYSPRGPVFRINNYESIIMNFFLEEVKKMAHKENILFLRFEPEIIIHNSLFSIHQTIDVQPSKTLILNLEKSEEELLKAMHEKTRYNIRLAEKRGVKIIEAGGNQFDDFWKLMEETGGRDDFRLHGKEYYKEMINIGGGSIKLFFAEYQKKVISAGIFSFFGDTVAYLHGASSNEFRNVMAPYLLQWHLIKFAKVADFKKYDFFGIDEKKWPGVTRFKKGFDGEEVNYPGTFDLIFDKGWYNIYRMARKIRRVM